MSVRTDHDTTDCPWMRAATRIALAVAMVGVSASMAWCNIEQRNSTLADRVKTLESSEHAEWRAKLDSTRFGGVVTAPSGKRYFNGDPCPRQCDEYVDGYTHGKALGVTKWRGCFDRDRSDAFVNGCLQWVDDHFEMERYDGANNRGDDRSITGRY